MNAISYLLLAIICSLILGLSIYFIYLVYEVINLLNDIKQIIDEDKNE